MTAVAPGLDEAFHALVDDADRLLLQQHGLHVRVMRLLGLKEPASV